MRLLINAASDVLSRNKAFVFTNHRPGRVRLLLAGCLSGIIGILFSGDCLAQPEGYQGVVAQKKPTVLYLAGRSLPQPTPIPKKFKLASLDELQFTGPSPSHQFVLGNFATDARWGIVDGCLQVVQGKNAALQLAWADQFELEGIMEQAGFGGWFFLIGWDNNRGFALHNVNMKESGSPWFLTELRGKKAVQGRTQEFERFDWRETQPFLLKVEEDALSLTIGKFQLLDAVELEGYTPGRIVLGTYDTRYGPKPLRVKSLRVRALPAEE